MANYSSKVGLRKNIGHPQSKNILENIFMYVLLKVGDHDVINIGTL
jgi:hypothetical protein